ncbi:tyrosine-protein phosphatase [Enterococcus ureasiticus]|uniref:Tyrosine specific protein phosphatases domain-containing protein n=1 Tax=Enterococcus ureasiticus TaxID=903984 RepID=A0A1E5G9U5_9ENTE|nr:tyrosine-protein phosphatase [Enterococcus ureasiticus]OEG09473.1 hypothetical protein BCR21_14045 [Enterococcus ureasiticus]
MNTITNFRDIGSKCAFNDKKVNKQQLFRSGSLTELTQTEQLFLTKDCKLKVIVDFRSEEEKKSQPDTVMERVKYVPINVLADSMDENGSIESMMTATIPADEMMEAIYKNLVLLDSAQKGYQTFLELLLEIQGEPLVFHCSAGKDRTGFASALVLSVLGVSKEAIYQDYLLTNKMRREANNKLQEQLETSYQLSDVQMDQLKQMLEVKKTYLDTAFATIDQEYGSFHTYVTQVLNFSDEKIAQLRKIYLK